jgi:hypothetical protein
MAKSKPGEATASGLTESTRTMIEGAVKSAIEEALVNEVVRDPGRALSFTRIFNKDAPDFSRIFSRGGAQLEDIQVRELATLEDAAFSKFSERLRTLQEIETSSEPSDRS